MFEICYCSVPHIYVISAFLLGHAHIPILKAKRICVPRRRYLALYIFDGVRCLKSGTELERTSRESGEMCVLLQFIVSINTSLRHSKIRREMLRAPDGRVSCNVTLPTSKS